MLLAKKIIIKCSLKNEQAEIARKILKRMIMERGIFILTDIEINYKIIITKTV